MSYIRGILFLLPQCHRFWTCAFPVTYSAIVEYYGVSMHCKEFKKRLIRSDMLISTRIGNISNDRNHNDENEKERGLSVIPFNSLLVELTWKKYDIFRHVSTFYYWWSYKRTISLTFCLSLCAPFLYPLSVARPNSIWFICATEQVISRRNKDQNFADLNNNRSYVINIPNEFPSYNYIKEYTVHPQLSSFLRVYFNSQTYTVGDQLKPAKISVTPQ